MKKCIAILLFLIVAVVYGQEKQALIIGNSNYSNFGTLRNPENDANDIEIVLRSLGFTVDKILNGSLNQMENATIRLKNRLTEAGNNAIGFFFYAGHGVEMGGINYLIPSDANIPDRNFLRERAFSMQIMLDILNDSRNALNIIVLDACRDFPAAWSRSLNRGLAIVSNPPANHIIMYATGAGSVANDGTGRNGLFSSHLLSNLKQPGMEINEIFRRTMGDVARASNNQQRPALYTDFSDTVYFNSAMASPPPESIPAPANVPPSASIPAPASVPPSASVLVPAQKSRIQPSGNTGFVTNTVVPSDYTVLSITGRVQCNVNGMWVDIKVGDLISKDTQVRTFSNESMIVTDGNKNILFPSNRYGRISYWGTYQ